MIDPSEDDVTRLILDTFDQQALRPLGIMTAGEFREFLLDDGTTKVVTSEMSTCEWDAQSRSKSLKERSGYSQPGTL